jgi:predicted enzyme related to lactoylglutathione lyase
VELPERPGAGVALWFKSDDAQRLHDELAGAGVPIVAAPVDGPFGRTFSFADPEGYVVTVHGQ